MAPDLTTITLPTGQRITVSTDAAPRFQGFLGDLSAAGAPLGTIGSYNDRNIDPAYTGGRVVKSQHALGNAVDVGDQTGRDQVSPEFRQWYTDHPDIVNAALKKYGIVSGADWQHPDLGHFELGAPPLPAPINVASNPSPPTSLLPSATQIANAAPTQNATRQPSSAGSSVGLPAYAWTPNAAPSRMPQMQSPPPMQMQPMPQMQMPRAPQMQPFDSMRAMNQLLAYVNSLKTRQA